MVSYGTGVPGGGVLVLRAGNSSSCSRGGFGLGWWTTATASLITGDDLSGYPLANPLVSAAVTSPEMVLFQVFSGTFSFCAAVSTKVALVLCVFPDTEHVDAEGAAMFFCRLFFLLALEVEGSELRVWFGGLEVEVRGLLVSPFTVSREEISNMVGTERNSC